MAQYFNITGELTKELLAPGNKTSFSKINLTNIDSTGTVVDAEVDLYIEKKFKGKFYLLKGVKIPIGATLVYENPKFSNNAGEFGLYMKLTKGTLFTLTGSIDPAASVTVPGTDTAFLSELSIGDEIVVSGETRVVTDIASDTSLTVSVAFSNNANDTSPDCNPVAPVDVILY